LLLRLFFFFSSRRRHTRSTRDWSSDVCSSDLELQTTLWKLPDLVGPRKLLNLAVHTCLALMGCSVQLEPEADVEEIRCVHAQRRDRKSTRLNSSHEWISYAVFCLKKKNKIIIR